MNAEVLEGLRVGFVSNDECKLIFDQLNGKASKPLMRINFHNSFN